MLQDLLLAMVLSIFGVGLGIFFLLLFSIGVRYNIRYDTALELENSLRNERMDLNYKMIQLLHEIGKPNMVDGSYSIDKMELWEKYYNMNDEYEEKFKQDCDLVWSAQYG